MGRIVEATCTACQHRFTMMQGGGFHFMLLRCALCGEGKSVSHKAVWEPYLAYLKGRKPLIPEPDGADWRDYQGEPISRVEFHRAVEAEAGECACGGQFTVDAPPRCPSCRSDAVEFGKTRMLFD